MALKRGGTLARGVEADSCDPVGTDEVSVSFNNEDVPPALALSFRLRLELVGGVVGSVIKNTSMNNNLKIKH